MIPEAVFVDLEHKHKWVGGMTIAVQVVEYSSNKIYIHFMRAPPECNTSVKAGPTFLTAMTVIISYICSYMIQKMLKPCLVNDCSIHNNDAHRNHLL